MIKISRNSHWRFSIKKVVLKNLAIFIRENLSCSLFLIKLFQHRCFPVNMAKLLRTPILKNICEQLLLMSSSTAMKSNICSLKQINVVRKKYVLCLFVSFWYYYICILSRGSRTDVFFKKLLLKVSQNSQESTCALKQRLRHRCFPVNFWEIFKNITFN